MKECFNKNYYKNYFFEKEGNISYDQIDWNEIVKEYIKKFKFDSFLDVGCGCGNLMQILSKKGKFVMGIENSEYAFKKAIGKKIPVIKLDIGKNKFPFPDKTFDIVHCFGVLEYLKDKNEILNAMKEISRVCKKQIIFSARFDFNKGDDIFDKFTNKELDFKPKDFWLKLWKESGNKKKINILY
ncbi:MAG: class I SAM-dependent methyltransferase [Nanoarchaeota archaeon]|nr:class I SAM-dependent methyltransferase [Nanoarchaeota archaeon]